MAQGEFMDKSVSSLVSYCGLYCGDCVIRRGELGSRAGVLLKEMGTPEFERLAEGLPGIHPKTSSDLLEYKTCIKVLRAMCMLVCTAPCKNGGGGKDCNIRKCCIEKGLEGCWVCNDFEECKTLAILEPVNKRANIRNMIIIRNYGMETFLNYSKEW